MELNGHTAEEVIVYWELLRKTKSSPETQDTSSGSIPISDTENQSPRTPHFHSSET